MDPNQSSVNNTNQSPINTALPNFSQKTPWPVWAIFVFSIINIFAAYFITWQSLKRMGRDDIARKFLFVGGGIIILLFLFLIFSGDLFPLPPPPIRDIIKTISAIAFPGWLYITYLKRWQEENPGKAKFSWSIIGWWAIGVGIEIVLGLLIGFANLSV